VLAYVNDHCKISEQSKQVLFARTTKLEYNKRWSVTFKRNSKPALCKAIETLEIIFDQWQ